MTTPVNPSDRMLTSDHDHRWHWFQRCWAIAVLSLLAATWRLWLPVAEFPQVPLFTMPVAGPRFSAAVSIGLALSLLCIVLGGSYHARVHWLLLVCLGLAFVLNQHRLQPWAYQAALHCLALAALPPSSARRWIAAITVSIYVYSAWGKFDYQFLHTVGQQFVTLALGPAEGAPSRGRLALAACLPLTELVIATGLCVLPLRRAAGIAAMTMHAGLLFILGPWMLGHSTGVLLWNAWLIPLSWFLFVAAKADVQHHPVRSLSGWPARLVLLTALLAPLLERAGLWDHWLSWSLYSPHTSRVEVELHQSNLESMPTSAAPFVIADTDEDQWHQIALDRWSLEALGVPLYPQARFQLGVAESLAERLPLQDGIRVKVKSASHRWNGSRSERWLRGSREINAATRDYWFLGRPRLDDRKFWLPAPRFERKSKDQEH